MTGDYFSWLSHDDMYRPNRTEKMVQAVTRKAQKDNLIVASSYTYFYDSTFYSPTRNKKIKPKHPLSYLYLGYINGCALLVPKKILMNDGVFNTNLPTTQDFDLWFRLFRKNNLLYINEELTLSRSHEEQGSKALLNDHIIECDTLWVGMMESLTASEKADIFGDEMSFYENIFNFLKNNTLYEQAIKYAKRKKLLLEKEKIENSNYKPDFICDLTLNFDKNKKTIFFPIFGHYSDRAGLNKMIAMVANGLSDKYNVIIASFTAKDDGYSLEDNVSYIYASSRFLAIDSLEDISIMFDVDLVVISHNCSKSGLDLIDRIKNNNTKVIAWNHEDYFLPFIKPDYSEVWAMRRDVFKKADTVLWLTNTSCAAYTLRDNNGYVMPNFVHFGDNSIDTAEPAKVHNNIIAVARFDDPRKRLYKILECYEILIESAPEISLTLLGTINYELHYRNNESIGQAINRINERGGRIHTPGFVNDIKKYYKKSDLHIMTSFVEGFGLTILESAHHGVPSVVFDNSGFDDIITDGKDGIIVPEANTEIMAKRILDLFNDKQKMISMKQSSIKIINKFDEDTIIKKWDVLIESILKNKKVRYSTYKYDEKIIQKISNNYENSLIEFSRNFIDYYNYAEKIKELYDRVLISRTWKYTQALREGASKLRKLRP
jgi:glycosyltransferase involved in cell wall biosynthesis